METRNVWPGVIASLAGVIFVAFGETTRAEGAVVEEVVVTARKRTELLQDTPLAIQVVQREQVERFASTDLSQVVEAVNNVDVVPGSSGAGGTFRVRGISASSADAGIESSVTVNVDGVQTARGHISRLPIFDVQSIQVLKGPQALYFGKDSPAGVIAITNAMPTGQFEAGLQMGYEWEAEEKLAQGFVSGPVSDTLNARLAFRLSDLDGWVDNTAGFIENSSGQLVPTEPYDFPGALTTPGAETNYSGRLTLDWQPTPTFRSIGRISGTRIRSDGFNIAGLGGCATDDARVAMLGLPPPGYIVDPNSNCELDRNISHGSVPREIAATWSPGPMLDMPADGELFAELDSWLGSLNVEWQRDWGVITAVTGYYAYDYEALDNFGSLGFGSNFLGFHPEDHEQWSQELRVLTQLNSPLNVMLGVYYETFDRDRTTSTKIALLGPDPLTGYSNSATVIQETEGDNYSAFGELMWDIGEAWQLSVGARYTRDEKEGTQFSNYVHQFLVLSGGFDPAFTTIEADFDDNQLSPEATLTWRPTSDVMLWGAYKTGYKSGGFSAPGILTANFTSESIVFEPEEAEGGEVGIKTRLFDDRMQLNATAYYYEFTDLQVTVLDTETTSFTIDNAAASTTYGLEADAVYLLSEDLSLRSEWGYNIAEYDSFPGAQCYQEQPVGPNECMDLNGDGSGDVQDLSGERWARAPKWAGSLGFDYSKPITGRWLLTLSGEGIFTGDMITSDVHLPEGRESSFWRFNTRIGLHTQDERWSLAMIGRNITDKEGIIGGTKPGAAGRRDLSATLFRKELLLQVEHRF